MPPTTKLNAITRHSILDVDLIQQEAEEDLALQKIIQDLQQDPYRFIGAEGGGYPLFWWCLGVSLEVFVYLSV